MAKFKFKFDETLETIINIDLENQNVPCLVGYFGIGKSSFAEYIARRKHTKCFTIACNQLGDKTDVTGVRLMPVDPSNMEKGYAQMFYPHHILTEANIYAKEHPTESPILFLDEINRTTPDVTSELLSIPTARRIGSTYLEPNLNIIIACNDEGNVCALDKASISRFSIYHVEPDTATFIRVNPGLNQYIHAVLTSHPELIVSKPIKDTQSNDPDDIDDIIGEENDMDQVSVPRTITGLSKFLNRIGDKTMFDFISTKVVSEGEEKNMLELIIESHVGRTAFSAALMSEIASNLSKLSFANTQPTVTVGKPAVYDTLKTVKTRSDLQAYINSMNERDKSGCLLYALTESQPSEAIITELANRLDNFLNEDKQTFIQLLAERSLDIDGMAILSKTNTNTGKLAAAVSLTT